MQAGGKPDSLDKGAKIIIVGLFIQLFFFGFFVIVSVMFNLSMKRNTVDTGALPFKKHMGTIFVTSFLIMVRSIFRVVEYIQGFDGYLLSHEVYLYLLDALLMLTVMLLLNYFHPAEITNLEKEEAIGEELSIDLNTSTGRY